MFAVQPNTPGKKDMHEVIKAVNNLNSGCPIPQAMSHKPSFAALKKMGENGRVSAKKYIKKIAKSNCKLLNLTE